VEEARSWVDRIRLAVETPDGAPPALNTPAGALWLFVTGSQANRELAAGQLDRVESTYSAILNALRQQPSSPSQRNYIASSYHQLGTVARLRGHLEDAERWYHQALTIKEDFDNHPGLASTYHQLGNVSYLRGRLEDAEDRYHQALAIDEDLGNRPGLAGNYHQLGMVAHDRGHLQDAERWYRQALTIKQDLDNHPGLASTYYQLGRVAQDRGHLQDAEDWSHRSLSIEEDLGNRPGMALASAQLGLLAEAQADTAQALTWMIKCVALFEEVPHPSTEPGSAHLRRLTTQLGMRALEDAWQGITGNPLPDAVREYVLTEPTDTN
jgi:tetratricopeptide (TPR) repeat protein